MEKPILFLVAHEPALLKALEGDLSRRFGNDCRILCERSPDEGIAALEALAARTEPVALLVADQRLPAMTGVDFLVRAHAVVPSAKRILLVERDYTQANPIVPAMVRGQIDYHLVKPWIPEQGLYPAVSDFLAAWAASREPTFKLFRIVGPQRSPRAHQIRDLLARMGMPYGFYAAESESGRRLLEEAGEDGTRLPVVVRHDGRVLVEPSDADLIEAFGGGTRLGEEVYDVAIVGAGPAGLTAAVYAASEVAARAVILATGVSWRRLGIERLEALIGAGVFYGAAGSEARAMEGQHVCIVGAGNSAGQAATHLARHAASVTMLVRGDSLATSMSEYLITELGQSPNVAVRLGVEVIDGEGGGHLEAVAVRDRASGATERIPTSALFVLIGAEPRTDWLGDRVERDREGYVLTGTDLVRDGRLPSGWTLGRPPFHLETSLPRAL